MLDGLIKCLPGFELKGGQIRVNGQYVSSLLVNGEDFFRGDPRVALENLPAYMVDKVKVYRKEHDYSYITQEQDKMGQIIPVEITAYEDRSFDFILKTPPAAALLKKAAGITKGTDNPLTTKVGSVTKDQVREIAETKMADLSARDIDAAMKIIEGTARSMGITVND